MTVPEQVPPRADCRLVSYNVLYQGVGPDGHGWVDRREAVIDELQRLRPDIITLQEVWMEQFDDLRDSLSEFSWIAATETPAHTPIAYRTDTFEVTEKETFWLSPPDAEPGTPAWDATYQRLATCATLDHLDTNRQVAVMNVHLDHDGEQARTEGMSLARDRLTAMRGDEAVLAGDFNCRLGDPGHRRGTEHRDDWTDLSNARSVAETVAGPTHTYTGFAEQSYDPSQIDHMLVSPDLDVERLLTCVPPSEPAHRPSDHRPVLADFAY